MRLLSSTVFKRRKDSENANGEPGGLPWGIRIASTFLDFFAIIMAIPMCLAGIAAAAMFPSVRHDPTDVWIALGWSWAGLGAFIVLLACVIGAGWLGKYMRASLWESAGSRWTAEWPRSPLLVIGQPVLLSVTIYSAMAEISWCLAKFAEGMGSWIWLVAWAVSGGGSYYLYRRCEGEEGGITDS